MTHLIEAVFRSDVHVNMHLSKQAGVQRTLSQNPLRKSTLSFVLVPCLTHFKLTVFGLYMYCRQLQMAISAIESLCQQLKETTGGRHLAGGEPNHPYKWCHMLPVDLPLNVVLKILSLLPDSHKVAVAKLVCKQAYKQFQQYKTVKQAIFSELPPLYLLKSIWPKDDIYLQQQLMAETAFQGDLHSLQIMRKRGCAWDETSCAAAADGGHLSVLQWLRAQHPPCPWSDAVCKFAAASNHLSILQWARGQSPPCEWGEDTCNAALYHGHLDMLLWLRGQAPPCPLSNTAYIDAASGGHIQMLEWLTTQEQQTPWGMEACAAAAYNGHIPVLQYLRSQDPPCQWGPHVVSSAASGGHLPVLCWLNSQDPPCACDWDVLICLAAECGHVPVLQWARSHTPSAQWSEAVWSAAARNGHVHVLQWLKDHQVPGLSGSDACVVAAQNDQLEALKWLRLQDSPGRTVSWGVEVCQAAAKAGNLRTLIWLRAQNPPCPWDAWVSDLAAGMGHLNILQWGRAQDPPVPWRPFTCAAAAMRGHLQVLQWLRAPTLSSEGGPVAQMVGDAVTSDHTRQMMELQQPCPWDADVTLASASCGHLTVLQWALAADPPAPWSAEACVEAARQGHIDILRWVAGHQPPLNWNKAACLEAAKQNQQAEVVRWLQSLPGDMNVWRLLGIAGGILKEMTAGSLRACLFFIAVALGKELYMRYKHEGRPCMI